MMTLIPHRSVVSSLTAAAIAFAAASCSVPTPNDAADSNSSTAAVDAETGTSPQDPSLAQARDRALVETLIESAERLIANGDYASARLELMKAQSRMPNNERVDGLLRVVLGQLGVPNGAGRNTGEYVQNLNEIRQQRAQTEVSALLDAAQRAADEENYDEALRLLRSARLNVEVGRDIEWGQLDSQVEGMIADVESRRDQADIMENEAIRRDIEARQRELSAAKQARIEARRDGFLQSASRAFENRQFSLAEDFSWKAMEADPNSQTARELHEISIKAARETRSDRYYRDMNQAIRRKLEADLDLKVPQFDLMRLDEETAARARNRAVQVRADNSIEPIDASLRARLREETLSGLSFTEEDGGFREVTSRVQTIRGIPIIISAEAAETIDGEDLKVTLNITSPMTIENLLNHMTSKSETLAWTVENGVVNLTTKEKAGGQNTQRLHDVRDLVYPRTQFLPPMIDGIPTAESDSETPRTGGEGEEQTFFIEMDPLVAAIKDATDPTYWDAEGGGAIDQTETGYLFVIANPEMQEAVRSALDDLRSFATAVVKVDSKFLTVSRNFLQQVGVDFRGLGGSGAKGAVATLDDVTTGLDDNASRGFDNAGTGDPAANPAAGAFFNDGGDGDYRARSENAFANSLSSALTPNGGLTAALVFLDDLQLQAVLRAVQKQEDVEEVNGQTVTIQNNERGYVAVINQTSYIRDFDVEVAQAAFIADPKVDVIQDGIVLDVRPSIHHDRKQVTLDLNPTVAELVRPIPTFSTSLAGTTQPVTLQLPQLTVRSFATTATVPDGGSLLIGGLREVLSIERRAEVPILGKIPLLSFFFKQESVVDENSSLMVLVTASITDVRDYVEQF